MPDESGVRAEDPTEAAIDQGGYQRLPYKYRFSLIRQVEIKSEQIGQYESNKDHCPVHQKHSPPGQGIAAKEREHSLPDAYYPVRVNT